MGQRTTVEMFDDLDGTTGEEIYTIPFALEGITYEIDLTEINLKGLRESLAPYVDKARRTGGKRKTQIGPSTKEIRDWARSNGIECPERGVIPTSVREAFAAAH